MARDHRLRRDVERAQPGRRGRAARRGRLSKSSLYVGRTQRPLRNRVTPLGDLVATAERGLVYGNRGCLHDDDGRIRRRHATRRWIACRLRFKDWHRSPLLQPGKFTELFFLDEATAFAAGHRPCALCRREDYNRFLELCGAAGADAVDARLHDERLDGRGRRLHDARLEDLPDGTFVLRDDAPYLVLGDRLLRWSSGGYDDGVARHRGAARVITPPSFVDVLRAGWSSAVPVIHPSARPPAARSTPAG